MKIAMQVTLEIDADDWSAEYGVDKANVRDDVKSAVASALFGLPVTPTTVKVK